MEILKEDKPFVSLIVGSPGSGKSHLIRYLIFELAKKKRFNHCIVISASSDINSDFDWQDGDYLYNTYSDELLLKIMGLQKIGKCGLLILDDCVGEANFNSKAFKKLITTFRHLKLSVILSVQYLNSVLPPLIRNCTSGAIWFKQDQLISLKALHEAFGQRLFKNLDEFKKYTLALKKFQFIYYFKDNEKESIDEVYRKMVAPAKIPEFKLKYKLPASNKRKREPESETVNKQTKV